MIRVKWAEPGRKSDRSRLLLLVGNYRFHISQLEAAKIVNQVVARLAPGWKMSRRKRKPSLRNVILGFAQGKRL